MSPCTYSCPNTDSHPHADAITFTVSDAEAHSNPRKVSRVNAKDIAMWNHLCFNDRKERPVLQALIVSCILSICTVDAFAEPGAQTEPPPCASCQQWRPLSGQERSTLAHRHARIRAILDQDMNIELTESVDHFMVKRLPEENNPDFIPDLTWISDDGAYYNTSSIKHHTIKYRGDRTRVETIHPGNIAAGPFNVESTTVVTPSQTQSLVISSRADGTAASRPVLEERLRRSPEDPRRASDRSTTRSHLATLLAPSPLRFGPAGPDFLACDDLATTATIAYASKLPGQEACSLMIFDRATLRILAAHMTSGNSQETRTYEYSGPEEEIPNEVTIEKSRNGQPIIRQHLAVSRIELLESDTARASEERLFELDVPPDAIVRRIGGPERPNEASSDDHPGVPHTPTPAP